MDIIDNYNKLSIGAYQKILEVKKEESLEDVDRQVRILSILTGQPEDEILHLPITEYKHLVIRARFLDVDPPYHQIAKKYVIGGYELIPVTDYRKLETSQYIDFYSYANDLDNRLAEFLSVILVPKGHRYNEGYDIVELQKAIREEMSISDGVSLAGFFMVWCRRLTQDSLNYSKQEARKIPNQREREKILHRIKEQEMRLGKSGDGSPM